MAGDAAIVFYIRKEHVMMSYVFRYFEGLVNPIPSFNGSFYKKKPTLLYFISKIKFLIFIIALAGLIKAVVDVGVIYIVGMIIDTLNGSDEKVLYSVNQHQLLVLAAILFIIIRPLTSLLIGLLCDQCIRAKFSPLVRWELYMRTINNDMAWFNRSHAGKISSAVWQSGQAVTEFLLSILQIIWSNVAYIILVIGFMSSLNFAFAGVIILWLIFYTTLSLRYAPRIKKLSRTSADASNVINGHLVDVFSNIANVKSLSPEGDEGRYISGYLNDFISKSVEFLRAITTAETLQMLTSSVAMVATGYISVISWQSGQLTVGEISVIFGLVFRLEALLATLMNQLTGAMRAIGLFNSSLDTLCHDNQVSDPDVAIPLCVVEGDIYFDNVFFEYERNISVICGLNLHIHKGERVAIVGESGSGKSTLLSLMLRFYDPDSGAIYLDNKNIKSVNQADLRRHFSVVSQDNILFNRSIYENITFGCDTPTEGELIIAAQRSKCLDFIEKSTDGKNRGFATLVGDRGVKLSGGQRQRLSLCRAMLRNAPVLILDEATSSLDSITESDIQASLNEVMENRTVIAVAHRLSTVIGMDRIIVLDKGVIIEEGTHDELVQKSGVYYALWKQQANL